MRHHIRLLLLIIAVLFTSCSEKGAISHYETLSLSEKVSPVVELNSPQEGGIVQTIQSCGSDKALFSFLQEGSGVVSITSHNQRTNELKTIEVPQEMAGKEFAGAVKKGGAHILLYAKNGESLGVYHTITNTYIEMPLPLEENAISDHTLSDDGATIYLSYKENGTPVSRTVEIVRVKSGFGVLDIVVIILYFIILFFIGYYFSKRQKSTNDYFKGGGRIPWWAAGLSLFGTALSAITFMAIPAKAFATDWSYMLFNVGIVLVAPVIMFVFIPFFRKLNITTAYEYLEVRFNSLIRVICSAAFIIFQIGRMGVVLFLPAIAINIVTGFDIFLCIALMGVFSIIYTRMGGIEAVVWTDALQVVILLGGALFAVGHILLNNPGGLADAVDVAYSNGKLFMGDTHIDFANASMWTVLIATFFTNLTTYGTDQSMVQRYLTTSSQKAAQKSVMTNALLTIPATLIFFAIGTLLFVYYKHQPAELSVSAENIDSIFPWYMYTKLPVGITGLLISGIFAAAMSTLSGSINSAATAYVVDIRPLLRKGKAKSDLKVAKRSTLIIGALALIFAFMMATWNIDSLWDEFNKILGLILGSMGGLFFLGMVTKRANAQGALIGMIVSIITQVVVAQFTPVHLLLYTTVGFITCFVVGYLASFLFRTTNN